MLSVFIKVSSEIKSKFTQNFSDEYFLEFEDKIEFPKIMIDEELLIIYDIAKVNIREMIKIRRLENSTIFFALKDETLQMTKRTEQFINAGLINYICPFSEIGENKKMWLQIRKILGKRRESFYREIALDKPILNTFFIYNLIYGDTRKVREMENFYKKHRLDFSPNLVMTLAIDDFWEICSELNNRDRYRIKMQCLKIVKTAILENSLQAVSCSLIGTEKIILLMYVAPLETNLAISFVREIAEMIRNKINQRLHYTVTIGISNLCESIDLLWRAYEESFQAINHSFFSAKNSILLYQELIQTKITSNTLYKLDELKNRFWIDLHSGIERINRDYYMDLFQYFLEQKISKENIKSIVINFVYEITDYLVKLGLRKEVLYREKESLNSIIIRSTVMDDIQKKLYEFSQKVLKILKEFKEGNNDISLNLAKSFIEKYYKEEIRLDELAKMSNMSSSYFSRKFKEKFQENYLEYLLRIRLEHATKLLRDSSLSIENIAEMVGFRDSSYFSRRFKKYFGVSPHFYRNREKNNDIFLQS